LLYDEDMKGGSTNTFFAILFVAIAGIAATWFIYHLATSNSLSDKVNANNVNGTEGSYSDLQQSLLK